MILHRAMGLEQVPVRASLPSPVWAGSTPRGTTNERTRPLVGISASATQVDPTLQGTGWLLLLAS